MVPLLVIARITAKCERDAFDAAMSTELLTANETGSNPPRVRCATKHTLPTTAVVSTGQNQRMLPLLSRVEASLLWLDKNYNQANQNQEGKRSLFNVRQRCSTF